MGDRFRLCPRLYDGGDGPLDLRGGRRRPVSLRELVLAVRDVLSSFHFVGFTQVGGYAQILLEAKDGVLEASVLFQATALVVDVGGILGIQEEVGEDGHPLGVATGAASATRSWAASTSARAYVATTDG